MAKSVEQQTPESEKKENFLWDIAHEVSVTVEWDERAVVNTLNLFDQENTIPFIARYRQAVTKGMTPEKLREVKIKYEELKTVREKVQKILKNPQNQEKLTPKIVKGLKTARTAAEVDHLSAPFKSGSKRSLAEKAKELGLEALANSIIEERRDITGDIERAINPSVKGLTTKAEVLTGLQHIIADRISKDEETLYRVRKLSGNDKRWFGDITIEVSQAKKSTAAKDASQTKKSTAAKDTSQAKKSAATKDNDTSVDASKFADYIGNRYNINHIKPHQVLAINRGENVKALSVKLVLAEKEKEHFLSRLKYAWIRKSHTEQLTELMTHSIDDSFKRLIEPLILRQARSELNKRAEKEAIDVFAANLKRLLLTPPVKGKVVLGVDPGFKHGCKYAVTSSTGSVLDTGVAYLHSHNRDKEEQKIRDVIMRNKCDTVAIGNGTACRETECFFSESIALEKFKPIRVQYCIVDEAGASIYSASAEAQRELPDYDVTIRGAVSIARRLQDPLAELVKIDPKHIGVGLYQHDCHEAKLKECLNEVTMECVSFTGVDLNSCSEVLLKKIAGLDSKIAERIIKYREENGGFLNREELKHIKGLGEKKFQQCSGFVRILPQTIGDLRKRRDAEETSETGAKKVGTKRKAAKCSKSGKKQKLDAALTRNPLDMTSIHPETYHIAERLLQELNLNKENIGSKDFIHEVTRCGTAEKWAKRFETVDTTMGFIIASLSQPVEWDFRETFEKPLFRSEVMHFDSLKVGTKLTGKVMNCVPFGVFVDVGVGVDGLLHNSGIRRHLLKQGNPLGRGDVVEVEVINIDGNARKKRLGLALLKVQ